MTFKDKFDLYYQSIITKSPYFEDLAEKYKYLLIESWKDEELETYYYDMENPKHSGMSYLEMNDWEFTKAGLERYGVSSQHDEIQAKVFQIKEQGNSYELPLFVEDKSIVCGDDRYTTFNNKEAAGVPDIDSFRFECVTPILTIDEYPTKDKIYEALYPLLSLYGLDRPKCFIQNYSMGFHVNASLYNKVYEKYIAIAEPPFLNRLLRNYIKVEKDIFTAVRPRGMARAPANYFTQFNHPTYKDYARPLYRNLEFFKRMKLSNLNAVEAFNKHTLRNVPLLGPNKPNTNKNEIINRIMTKDNYIEFKYKGIKRKSPFLLEFRLFEGESEIRKLITHVFTALDILHKTANEIARDKQIKLTNKTQPIANVNNNDNNNAARALNYENRYKPLFGGKRNKTVKKKYKSRRKTQRK
jgi:hypothetical protein